MKARHVSASWRRPRATPSLRSWPRSCLTARPCAPQAPSPALPQRSWPMYVGLAGTAIAAGRGGYHPSGRSNEAACARGGLNARARPATSASTVVSRLWPAWRWLARRPARPEVPRPQLVSRACCPYVVRWLGTVSSSPGAANCMFSAPPPPPPPPRPPQRHNRRRSSLTPTARRP